MPVIRNLAGSDAQNVGGHKFDGLTGTLDASKGSREMAREAHVRHHTITSNDLLQDTAVQVRNGLMELQVGDQRPGRSLGPPLWQIPVREGRRDDRTTLGGIVRIQNA